MKIRWGLQAKMTASYVVVTALAVLIALAIVIGLVAPKVLSSQDLVTRAQATASTLATQLWGAASTGGIKPSLLGVSTSSVASGSAIPDSNGGLLIPVIQKGCEPGSVSFALLVDPRGVVQATSYPSCFPVGSKVSSVAPDIAADFSKTGSGTDVVSSRKVVWATEPLSAATQVSTADTNTTVYVQAPAVATSPRINASLVRTGLLILLLTIPVGVVFGSLSTRGITRRLVRLAESTQKVADGEFNSRIEVSGDDEVSNLEGNFNDMAEQLQTSLSAERELAGANARHEERSRIARELHDSISQDLFSLSMLAGGLRKALPPDSSLMPEVETMERTAGATMREMQALLLELRPVALDEVGLSRALQELCDAYRERLGIEIAADLEEMVLPTGVEHAVLRIAQESLANAVRHADPKNISLSLHDGDGRVVLEVADDGRGFDHNKADGGGAGLGLRAMKNRMSELGGELSIDTTQGSGTTVRASFPVRPA